MKITLQQTGSNDDLGQTRCCICERRFYLAAATCWAISEESNILHGEVCPTCLEGGPIYIQERLDYKAWWSRFTARVNEETAAEGISDCPTVDEFLAAEAFYGKPQFKTGQEYEEALGRGEID